MRIRHSTNVFLPHVGGVARAVQTLLGDQRHARHRVLVVAPVLDPIATEGRIIANKAGATFHAANASSLPIAA